MFLLKKVQINNKNKLIQKNFLQIRTKNIYVFVIFTSTTRCLLSSAGKNTEAKS